MIEWGIGGILAEWNAFDRPFTFGEGERGRK